LRKKTKFEKHHTLSEEKKKRSPSANPFWGWSVIVCVGYFLDVLFSPFDFTCGKKKNETNLVALPIFFSLCDFERIDWVCVRRNRRKTKNTYTCALLDIQWWDTFQVVNGELLIVETVSISASSTQSFHSLFIFLCVLCFGKKKTVSNDNFGKIEMPGCFFRFPHALVSDTV